MSCAAACCLLLAGTWEAEEMGEGVGEGAKAVVAAVVVD